jgi:hypothetical protein
VEGVNQSELFLEVEIGLTIDLAPGLAATTPPLPAVNVFFGSIRHPSLCVEQVAYYDCRHVPTRCSSMPRSIRGLRLGLTIQSHAVSHVTSYLEQPRHDVEAQARLVVEALYCPTGANTNT